MNFSPKLVEVGRHNNIEVLTTLMLSVEGSRKLYVIVVKRPKYVIEDNVQGATCTEYCPVSYPDHLTRRYQKI